MPRITIQVRTIFEVPQYPCGGGHVMRFYSLREALLHCSKNDIDPMEIAYEVFLSEDIAEKALALDMEQDRLDQMRREFEARGAYELG